jgi:hypothetical protein
MLSEGKTREKARKLSIEGNCIVYVTEKQYTGGRIDYNYCGADAFHSLNTWFEDETIIATYKNGIEQRD